MAVLLATKCLPGERGVVWCCYTGSRDAASNDVGGGMTSEKQEARLWLDGGAQPSKAILRSVEPGLQKRNRRDVEINSKRGMRSKPLQDTVSRPSS